MATNYNKDHHNATPLYNGNISALTTDYLTTEINPLVKFFRYDKLNRIKGMKTNSDAGNPQCQPFYTYSTYYTYDHNGNLDTLIRYDSETNELHYIEYEYLSGNNRLDSITAWWGLNTCGYRYDAIGNLIRDNGEGLDISWNAAGKVDTIWKNGNVLSTFRYSATGQRQMKKTGDITDYYIHDASGNVMCIYRGTSNLFKAVERPIYGAKRLGELKQEVNLTSPTNPSIPSFTIGIRQYELTDHLGNVMATILDRRQPMTLANSDAYLPWIVSTTDYYPFGYPIPNRSTDTGGYRYFFNGQEGDNEVFGEVALHAFEYRMHDARLGRFWSVDPLAAKYPWNSTYAFAENSPVGFLELEGLERLLAVTMGEDVKYRASFIKTHNSDVENLNIKNGEIAIGILANFLVENTKKDEKGIGFIAIFSHGIPNNIFVKGDFGNGISSYDLDEIGSLVDNQSIKFFEECVIYLGGCNTGTEGDMINKEGEVEYLTFAQRLADMTNATVIAANDRVTPIIEKKDGSEMSYSVSNPKKGSFFLYRKGQNPVSIGRTVNIMDYFKKIENKDTSNSDSDGQ